MKPIKVCEANRAKIAEYLRTINGAATRHVCVMYGEVLHLCDSMEIKLASLLRQKKHFPGAQVCYVSGAPMPNAYKYSRRATMLKLERRSAGWFIVGGAPTTIWKEGGRVTLQLTHDQHYIAMARFRESYALISEGDEQ